LNGLVKQLKICSVLHDYREANELQMLIPGSP
jgi:hypothetical protein